MKYVLMILMLLSLTACISNSSSGINAAMGIPEMVYDGTANPNGLIGVVTAKKKPTVPVETDEIDFGSSKAPKSTGECESGYDC